MFDNQSAGHNNVCKDGLTGPWLMIFAQGQSDGRVNPQKIGVVVFFITGGYLINPFPSILSE
jgi:hypothetical protein